MTEAINLSKILIEPLALERAIAFYVSYGVTTVDYAAEERECHYGVLENAGYIERVGVICGVEE